MQKRVLDLWHRKDFLAPTPSVRQPLFETSETNLAWLPLQSLAVMKKRLFFVQILGGEKVLEFVEKCAGEIFLSGLRGPNFFQTRFGSFFGSFFFRVSQTVFRIDLKVFFGGSFSEKFLVSQESVSGFPEKGADLRGSPRTSGELWGTSGEVWETSGEPLDCC